MEGGLPQTLPDGKSTHRRIADSLRRQIITGDFPSGSRLPSTTDLAATWNTSVFTIHTALRTLVKEGWIDRRMGAGTFIADARDRFRCAGIYHQGDIAANDASSFARRLHFALVRNFERLGKSTQVFFDSREEQLQGPLLPDLAAAIRDRRIQCLVAPSVNAYNMPNLAKLSLPKAFVSTAVDAEYVVFDELQMFRETTARFAAQGCRSVGMINHLPETFIPTFYPGFLASAKAAGLAVEEDWLLRPPDRIQDLELFGYRAFKTLWKLPKRPDALLVHPDEVVRGSILAILEIGYQDVLRKMRLIFHRNAHGRVLCPFPVTWAVSDEEAMARSLTETIQKQFEGERVKPVIVPYSFEMT